MALEIRTKRDVRIVTGVTTLVCIAVSESVIGLLILFGGENAFRVENAIVFAGIIPILLAIPITYYISHQSMVLAVAKQALQQLADTDALTRLPNRRAFFEQADQALGNASAQKSTCTLMVIDADYFKNLNDSFGHAVGDRALVAIADALRENFRDTDLLCRVGGEEFAVLLPDIGVQDAQPLAQRLVDAVAGSPLMEQNTIIEYSISCGLADTTKGYTLAKLFKIADDAMYQAKAHGRNRVHIIDVAA